MKILHVIANLAPRYGGPSKACVEMAQAVARLGHNVTIYTTNQDGPTELDVPIDHSVFRENIEIRFFPIQKPRFWGTSMPMALALRQKIQEVDLVHIHSLYLFYNLVAAHYCRIYGTPYLVRPHGMLDPFIYYRHRFRKKIMELLFENRNIKQAAAIHFTTDEEKQLAEPYLFKTRGIVIPHGLYLAEYENLPALDTFKNCYPETKGKKIILFFGRINFKKGLDILVQAFAKVVQRHDEAYLVIAGPDDDGLGEKVRADLKNAGILDRTIFTGMLQGKHKLAVLQDAEMFVLPSYSENFGISVVEAMASGLPVIISNKVNIWREVEKGQAGLVAPCNVEQFAKMMENLLDNPEKAKQLGQNGKTLVTEKFQWPSVAFALEQAYQKIISNDICVNKSIRQNL
jgi:glycosyltransferase involved in cell wall biosynthesis